jgi:hypothetical protein
MLMLLLKLTQELKLRLMCVGNVLENAKVSISGQATKERKRNAFGKAQAQRM